MYLNSEIELENGCWMSIYDLYTKIYEADDWNEYIDPDEEVTAQSGLQSLAKELEIDVPKHWSTMSLWGAVQSEVGDLEIDW